MTSRVLFCIMVLVYICFCLFLLIESSLAVTQNVGLISPGFQASQAEWINHNGMFLLSNNSVFGFGFNTDVDSLLYLLVVLHLSSLKAIWTANRYIPVSSSDKFVFGSNGNAYLGNSTGVVWSTGTVGDRAKAIKLEDSGNLVLLGEDGKFLWQSFNHPTDTLISGQKITEGIRVESIPKKGMISYLEIKSGDAVLYAGYDNGPQVYWSMSKETRKTVLEVGGKVSSAAIVGSSWNFYDDQTGVVVWQFNISNAYDPSALWIAVLGSDGSVQFINLEGKASFGQTVKIPKSSCNVPIFCDPFEVCSNPNQCQCPTGLGPASFCKPPVMPLCKNPDVSYKLQLFGEGLDYSVLGYVSPKLNTTSLDGCKQACDSNCSCNALFFNNSTCECFLFDQVGTLQHADPNGTTGYTLIIKAANVGVGSQGGKHSSRGSFVTTITVCIIVVTLVVISALVAIGFWYYRRKKRLSEAFTDVSEEDNFFEGIAGVPVRYRYNDLSTATKNFSVKLGQGGFGSVYLGTQADGTKLAVKKLEGVGQGSKEFKAEVNIIGSIHHVHLVKLKGFCAEGAHRLLVYEYMGNGSLERWIFNNDETRTLDWETRYNIALGTAKGLAYLHEECDVKIVHCDIKPENVLLDDHFVAKVSDFGLAKLMNREQSLVMTTLRGTRGYLAPEWLTNFLISEKSDVYSYGMLLLEIIGGRKNYEAEISSEKSYFPLYAFKMMEEGKLNEILDARLKCDGCGDLEKVHTAIKVALWCIQEDISVRPPMTKVVQMLQGLCPVPDPPVSHPTAARLYSGFLKPSSEDSNCSLWTVENNRESRDTTLSAIRLSGPR